MKPQDVAVALALALENKAMSYAVLGSMVGISASEAHGAVARLRESKIVGPDKRVNRTYLLDFLFHGFRFAFPGRMRGLAVGVPTGAARLGDIGVPDPEMEPWVWPSAEGTLRGLAVEPLYPAAPDLAPGPLADVLAALDLLRLGRAREVAGAKKFIAGRLGDAPTASAPDLGGSDVLNRVYTRELVSATFAKRAASPHETLGEHPLMRPIAIAYGDELADVLVAQVLRGTFEPTSPAFLEARKSDGGTRIFSMPCLLDVVVATRAIEEVERALAISGNERVFMSRNRASALDQPHNYREGKGWAGFVSSVRRAATESGLAEVLSTDIAQFFPSIDHALARQILAQRTGAHFSILSLLFRCLGAWNAHDGSRSGVGLPIELNDVSRVVAHALLGPIDDEFEDDYRTRYRRFMDDVVIFVESESEAQRVRTKHKRALAALGLAPNPSKTKSLSTANYLKSLGPNDLDASFSRARSVRDVARLHSQIRNTEWQAHGLNRLYGLLTARGLRGLETLALEDLEKRPEVADAALRYLQEQTLSADAFAALARWYDAAVRTPYERAQCARSIVEARVEEPGLTREWARGTLLENQDDGCGLARATLLYGYGKWAPRADWKEIVESSSSVAVVAGDRAFVHALRYVATALGARDAFALSLVSSSDIALTERLISDVCDGTLREPAKVLEVCRTRRHRNDSWRLRTTTLPLLVAFQRANGACRDALRVWCDETLEESHAPNDPLLVGFLESLRQESS